jgi:hypothetical protein
VADVGEAGGGDEADVAAPITVTRMLAAPGSEMERRSILVDAGHA